MRGFGTHPTFFTLVALLALAGCGAKGDPVPNRRHPPTSCVVRAVSLRKLEAVLPKKDTQGNSLRGIDTVRIYYLQMGQNYPSPLDVYQHGTAILELSRPNLPSPGKAVTLDISDFGGKSGWLVVVAFRAGNIAGVPSEVMPWFDPTY
jgi:hypothetical protein